MAQLKKKPTQPDNLPATKNGDKPAYLVALEKKGPIAKRDNFDSQDITIPRVKLLQALSQEVENYDKAKAGEFWHTGLDEALGDSFEFVIVSRRKRYLLVAPLKDGQGILARSEDFIHWTPPHGSFEVKVEGSKKPVTWTLAPTVAESGLDKWGTYNPDDENSPPAATLFYEYLILLPDHMDFGPVVLSLTRSQIKKARKGINDKVQLHESAGRPMQSVVFRAKAVREESQEGPYYNFQFTSAGFAPERVFNQAWEYKDMLHQYRVKDELDAARGQDAGKAGNVESKDY